MNAARLAAARVLMALEDRRATLGAELERARVDIGDVRDRALLVEIVTGTLRWRSQLDALIAAASQRAVRDIDPRARSALRLAVYQLRHLSRVPAHAVVSDTVDVVRAIGAAKAAGFVNAVLRAVIRRGPSLALPRRPSADGSRQAQLRYLSITLSHPSWLVDRWLTRYGFENTARWCEYNNQPAVVTIRSVGRLPVESLLDRLREAAIAGERAPYVGDAIRLPAGALGMLPPAIRDEIVVQDEGAQLVARVIAARPGEHVLDVCASPGGKTLVCAADMGLTAQGGSGAMLVAADYRPARVQLLAETIARAGLRISIARLDAREPLPFGPAFDAVLLDAPCSGLGTLRRDPDLKWTREAGDLPALAADEARMIDWAAAAVRPGGRLLYATCSPEPEEDESVVERFLERQRGAFVRAAKADLPAGMAPLTNGAHDLATLPFRDGLDAYYAALLVRRQPA